MIIGAFLAFFLAFVLLSKKEKQEHDKILVSLFILFGLTILLAYFEIINREMGYPYPFLISISPPFILLHGPFLWWYVKSLTTQHYTFKLKFLLHLLPFACVVALMSKGIFFATSAEKIAVDASESFRQSFIFPLVIGLITITTLSYYSAALLLLKKYRSRIKSYFAEIEKIDFHWLRFLILTSIAFHFSICILYIADYLFHIMNYNLLQIVGFSFASMFVLALGFFGIKNSNVFVSNKIALNIEKIGDVEFSNQALNSNEDEFIKELLAYMKNDKPFLNQELTLAELSAALHQSPEFVSSILNGRLNKNFFDFINYYRVEEFKARCLDPQYKLLTIISIAFDSGFNSKATFNRVFKKSVGLTPGEYVKKMQQQNSI